MTTSSRLFGFEGDAILHVELDDVIKERYNDGARDDQLPFRVIVDEFSCLPKGDSGSQTIMSGAAIAEWVAETFSDDCGFEVLAETYTDAAAEPDVIAAFQAAVDLMISKQTFLVADRVVARHEVLIFPDGGDCPSWKRLSTTKENQL
jgi:hypothetical protein